MEKIIHQNYIKRIQLLYKLKKNYTNILSNELYVLNENYKSELNTLKKLKDYKKEYLNKFKLKIEANYSKNDFVYRDLFINYLQTAQEQQKQIINNIEKNINEKREFWIKMQNRLQALSNYISKIKKQIINKINRDEQKEIDTYINDYYNFKKL